MTQALATMRDEESLSQSRHAQAVMNVLAVGFVRKGIQCEERDRQVWIAFTGQRKLVARILVLPRPRRRCRQQCVREEILPSFSRFLRKGYFFG